MWLGRSCGWIPPKRSPATVMERWSLPATVSNAGVFPQQLVTLESSRKQTPREEFEALTSVPAMHFENKGLPMSLKPLLLVERESARVRRARYSDPLVLQKWSQIQAGMGDIGLSDALPTDDDSRPPFSAPPPLGGAPLQQMEPLVSLPRPGIPVANLPATDFAK